MTGARTTGAGNDATALARLAERAGLALEWQDALGHAQRVSDETARTLLDALGLPCDTASRVRQSHAVLDAEASPRQPAPLITAEAGRAIALQASFAKDTTRYRVELEQGDRIDGFLSVPRGQPGLLSPISEPGYHTLTVNDRQIRLAVAPPRCYTVRDALAELRGPGRTNARGGGHARWGIAVQAYALRRPNDGGIGDYTALADFARRAAAHGADALAVSPLHAMFSAEPAKSSPYSPSSRRFLNALHIDAAAVFGEAAMRAAIDALRLADELARLEALPLVDWPDAARARLTVLRALFDRFAAHGASEHPALVDDFRAFCTCGGRALEDHARFEALHAKHIALEPARGHWRDWPCGLRDPRSAEINAFADAHRTEIDFHRFLQWLAARGLDNAQRAARDSSMAMGIIADLAVGCDSAGSDAWSCPHDMLQRISIGAPPDLFNQAGQSWGLTTFSPRGLRANGFAPFIDMLRAAFGHAGGIRIDHILGLRRLWLVPEGASARDGAYLRYPLDDLLRLIALESWRHRAIVIGEDLGTVPAGFRTRLATAGLLGIRVLWFERGEAPPAPAPFKPPGEWDADVVATTTTHDLPTVTGWWQGVDIDERARIGQTAPASAAAARRERAQDRAALWSALQQAGLAPREHTLPAPSCAPIDEALAFVARTPATLVTIPLEDLTGMAEQPNLPGSTDEHPNWRRRIAASIDALFSEPAFVERLARVATGRAHADTAANAQAAANTDAQTHTNPGAPPPRKPST